MATTPKTCNRCGETKPPAGFYRDRSKRDGLSSACKPCCALKRDEWRAKNPDRYRDQYVAQNKRHYIRDRDGYRDRTWVAKLASKGHETDATTRAYATVLVRDPCTYCGRRPGPGEHFGIDHIDPLGDGGAHDWENLTACCKDCNSQKWKRPALEFMLWRVGRGGPDVEIAA